MLMHSATFPLNHFFVLRPRVINYSGPYSYESLL